MRVVVSMSLKVSLKATDMLMCIGKGKIILGRPSIITFSHSAGIVGTVNRRTHLVLKEAPKGVVTMEPLERKIVSSCAIARGVVGCFIRGTLKGHAFGGPEVDVYMPDNIARMRGGTIRRTAFTTKTERIRLVRRPITTTVKTKVSVSGPYKGVVISVNKNATSVTIVSLNKAIIGASVGVTNSSFSRTVMHCVEGGRGLLVKREATRSVGVGVKAACPLMRRRGVRIEKHGLMAKLPGAIAIASSRARRTLERSAKRVMRTMVKMLRRAPPRLSTSVLSQKVILAKKKSLLHKLRRLVRREAKVGAVATRSPVGIITVNAKRFIRFVDKEGRFWRGRF